MENQKLLHPSVDVLLVDGTDQETLELAMCLLHDLGWITQQCGIDAGLERVKFIHEHLPKGFVMACATGHAALHRILGRTSVEP